MAASVPEYLPIAFVDTSAIVALVDREDHTHGDAVNAYHSLVDDGYRLFTTNHVIRETYDLLASTLGHTVAAQWLSDVGLAVYVTDNQDETRARERILAAGPDRPLRYSDAISLSVMERLGIVEAFAVDPDFLESMTG
ncbi:MAG: PIN domain-containing protein [Thermomicrobiales bacterium]|nr:PIN domain-containing protein [Thermomicrobiales bacterium]